jgi:molybdopterin converting factor small subunit
MATVRLFAHLRELAGASEVQLEGSTVHEILGQAADRYGSEFEEGLRHSRVWVNGDPADGLDEVRAEDEVALLPPVSGGAGPSNELRQFGPFLVSLLLLVTNALKDPVWFVAALVGVAALWAWDLSENGAFPGPALRVPLLVAALAGAVIPYAWSVGRGGWGGLGLAVLVAVLTVLIRSVLVAEGRDLVSTSVALTAAVVAAGGVGSLVLARIATTSGQRWIWLFLMMVIGARGIAAYLSGRELALDPLSGSVVVAVIMGIVAALVFDLNGFAAFLVAIVVAVVLIVGAAFASLMSTREVYFARRLPGVLPDVGAGLLAALVFLPVAWTLLPY